MTFVGESTISLSVLPDETAAALFRRKAGRPFHTGLSLLDTQKRPGRTEPGLFQGDVVELHGESNAGKTEVLMNAVTHVVAPDDPCVPPRTAVYFDHDGRLDLVRLQTILLHHIRGFESTTQATTVGLAPTEVELSLVRAAMERVWVIRCAHTFEFVAALEVLHAELRGKEALVCLDNLGSFHFRDKQTEASCGEGATLSFHALRCLTRLVADRPVLLLAAKPVLFKPRERGGPAMDHREFMPQAWQNLVSMRVNLVRRRPLPSEIALDTAAASSRPRNVSAAAARMDTLTPAWRFEMWISKGTASFQGGEHVTCTCRVFESGISESNSATLNS